MGEQNDLPLQIINCLCKTIEELVGGFKPSEKH